MSLRDSTTASIFGTNSADSFTEMLWPVPGGRSWHRVADEKLRSLVRVASPILLTRGRGSKLAPGG